MAATITTKDPLTGVTTLVIDVTVADGATESSAAKCAGYARGSYKLASPTGTTLTYEVSEDGTTWAAPFSSAATAAAVVVSTFTDAKWTAIPTEAIAPYNYIRLKMGSAQTGAKTFRMCFKSV